MTGSFEALHILWFQAEQGGVESPTRARDSRCAGGGVVVAEEDASLLTTIGQALITRCCDNARAGSMANVVGPETRRQRPFAGPMPIALARWADPYRGRR